MGEILRPRFGRPCFECQDTVPAQRAQLLTENAASPNRRVLKSDIICVDCERRARQREAYQARDRLNPFAS